MPTLGSCSRGLNPKSATGCQNSPMTPQVEWQAGDLVYEFVSDDC